MGSLLEKTGRVSSILVGIVFLGVGVGGIAGLGFSTWITIRSYWWVFHPCTIQEAHLEVVEKVWSGLDKKLPQAQYSWEWQGKVYHGDSVTFHSFREQWGWFSNDTVVTLSAVAGQPDGYRCWVNPDRPEEAVLYRDLDYRIVLFAAGLIAVDF